MPSIDEDVMYFSEACEYIYMPPSKIFKGNIFKHGDMISIIKISRSKKPFWGINANMVDAINTMKDINFSAIFLTSKTTGYYYNLSNLSALIKERNLKKIQNDYKINSPLQNCFYFSGIEKFKSLAFSE